MEFEYVKSPKRETTATPGASASAGAAAVTEPPEPPPAATPEELAQSTRDLYKSMGWGDPPAEVLSPARPASFPEGQAAPPAAPAAPTAEPPAAPAQPPEPEPEPEPSAAQLISQAARETAREVARELRPEPPPPPAPEPTLELSEADKKDLEILSYLERTNPRKYAGIVQRTLDYYQAYYEYIQAWLDAHPGTEYDEDAAEHVAWTSENQPKEVSREDLDEARIQMIAEQQYEERYNREVKPIFDQQEQERALARDAGRINHSIDEATMEMVRIVDPTLAAHFRDANGHDILSNEAVAKIEAADPIAKDIMDKIAANELQPLIAELQKLTVPELKLKLNPAKNPVHATLMEFITNKERQLAAMPASQRMMDGKRWVSCTDYAAMASRIQQGRGTQDQKDAQIRELDDSVWCLDVPQIQPLIIDFYGKKARAIIVKQNALAEKKYGKAPAAGAQPPAPPPPNPPRPSGLPPVPRGKPRPPAGGDQAVSVTTQQTGTPPQKTYGETATDVMFGR